MATQLFLIKDEKKKPIQISVLIFMQVRLTQSWEVNDKSKM